MTIQTSDPWCPPSCKPEPTPEFPVADIAYARHAIPDEDLMRMHRCQSDEEDHDHDLTWTDEDEDKLNADLKDLGHWLDDHPARTWDRDIRSTLVNVHWKVLREWWSISLNETGKRVGVDSSTVSRWERGERSPDSTQTQYRDFLTQMWGNLVAMRRFHVYVEAMIRDRWPHTPTGPEQQAQWDEFWRPGGFFDQWRKTGSLPNTNRWGEVRTEEPAAVS